MIGSPSAGNAVYSSALDWQRIHLGVLADLVEKANVTLVAGDCQLSARSGRCSRKVILRSVLLELAFDKFVASDTRIDPE
jgi:hypothetical protein